MNGNSSRGANTSTNEVDRQVRWKTVVPYIHYKRLRIEVIHDNFHISFWQIILFCVKYWTQWNDVRNTIQIIQGTCVMCIQVSAGPKSIFYYNSFFSWLLLLCVLASLDKTIGQNESVNKWMHVTNDVLWLLLLHVMNTKRVVFVEQNSNLHVHALY